MHRVSASTCGPHLQFAPWVWLLQLRTVELCGIVVPMLCWIGWYCGKNYIVCCAQVKLIGTTLQCIDLSAISRGNLHNLKKRLQRT